MLNKFQVLVDSILEDVAAGAGGAFGTPAQPVYNPASNISSGDTYAPNDARNLFGNLLPSTKKGKSNKLSKRLKNLKNKFKKVKPLVIRRTLQRKAL
jgi:hypothetical protein